MLTASGSGGNTEDGGGESDDAMRDLLRAPPRLWHALALPGTLVALDFDGTLARIVRNREHARLGRLTRRALARVAAVYPVAILSGRAAADVAARLEGIPVRWIVGSHGAEWPGSRQVGTWRAEVRSWRRALRAPLAGVRGVDVEDKGLSLAVHYRAAAAPRDAARIVARACAGMPGARAIRGKMVLNLVPAAAGDKGSALARLARRSRAARVLFVGDDVTDEAAFAANLPVPFLPVRVGRARDSAARYCVENRAGVDRLLRRLAAMRKAPAGDR